MTDIAILCQFWIYKDNKPLIDKSKKDITVEDTDVTTGRNSPKGYVVVPKSTGSVSPSEDDISEDLNSTKA